MGTCKSSITRFVQNEEGVTFIFFAFASVFLFTAVALAVDYTRFLRYRNELQSAIDHASLAAAGSTSENRPEQALKLIQLNLSQATAENVIISEDGISVRETTVPGKDIVINIRVTASMRTEFGKFVGLDAIPMVLKTQATRDKRNIETVMVLSNGATMCGRKVRFQSTDPSFRDDIMVGLKPDPACDNLNALKKGASKYVEILKENELVANLKLGLIPYSVMILMPEGKPFPPSVRANEPDKYKNGEPGMYKAPPQTLSLSRISPLSSRWSEIEANINDIKQSTKGSSWSRSNVATHMAALMLDPAYTNYFGGEKPDPFAQETTDKVVILMTDGINSGCCFTAWPPGNIEKQYVYHYKPDNEQQVRFCNALKEQGVKIYTILLDVEANDPGGVETQNVFARCASLEGDEVENPNGNLRCNEKQNCYNTKNAKELEAAFKNIARTFYDVRLTK